MDGSYLDGKEVDKLTLPNNCIILSIRRDHKTLPAAGETLVPATKWR